MKKSLAIFSLFIILFGFQKVFATNEYYPIVKNFTPTDGTVLMISEAETGTLVDIYLYIENLRSASSPWHGYMGFEIWVTDNGKEIFHFKNDYDHRFNHTFGPKTISSWMNVGFHEIKLKAKA